MTPHRPRRLSTMLLKVAKKIEQGWCQYHFAVDKFGVGVAIDSPEAVKWCLVGACVAVDDASAGPIRTHVGEYFRAIGHNARFWNDAPSRRKSQVVALLNKLAKQAKKEGL